MNHNPITISQILNWLDHPQSNIPLLNQYLITYYSQLIILNNQTQLNRLTELINLLHLNVQNKIIDSYQRRSILQKLASQRYQNIIVFENTLAYYIQQYYTNKSNNNINIQTYNTNPNPRITNQSHIQNEHHRRQQQKANTIHINQLKIQEYQHKQNIRYQLSNLDTQMECPICLETIKYNHLAILDCKHHFHKNCTFKHFSQCINDRKLPLKCPECSEEVILSDIQSYLTYEYKEKYQKYTYQRYLDINQADLSWCPTPGCEFVFVFDQQITKFRCPCCMKKYCLKCKQLAHSGRNCIQSQNDKKFLKFVKGAKYKQCTKCRRWVQKKSGCDHITCLCGNEFCYKCGGPFGSCNCQKKVRSRTPPLRSLWNRIFSSNDNSNQNNTNNNNQNTRRVETNPQSNLHVNNHSNFRNN